MRSHCLEISRVELLLNMLKLRRVMNSQRYGIQNLKILKNNHANGPKDVNLEIVHFTHKMRALNAFRLETKGSGFER